MLPSHGFTYSVFLLARACQVVPPRSHGEWLSKARKLGSVLAVAVDLHPPAKFLIEKGFAVRSDDGTLTTPRLQALSMAADRFTLRNIARLIMCTAPPPWLRTAVTRTAVAREYIPESALGALLWLEPELDQFLIEACVASSANSDEVMLKAMGDAGERLIMAALDLAGQHPVHVARISDSYGYDIETQRPPVRRIEVKSASQGTRTGFYLSRNEYETCRRHPRQWLVLQVTFSSEALFATSLGAEHVSGMRCLSANDLVACVPPDQTTFRWAESARITPPPGAWVSAGVTLNPDFRVPGFAASTGPARTSA